jgi:hypothetical protein
MTQLASMGGDTARLAACMYIREHRADLPEVATGPGPVEP